MAVPKRKTSKARRDKRRNNVWKISAPTLVRCSNCGEYKRPHRLCSACGHYDGREVVKVGEEFVCLSCNGAEGECILLCFNLIYI